MSSPSSSSTSQWKYEVFISFRGVDTRRGFTDHLYAALRQKGILTFRDDEELERGKPISPELLKVIEESRLAIVIFSKNYAFSTWCLDELAKIVRCMREMRLMIWPIFYNVDPSDVRKQLGTFGQAFKKHEKLFKENIKMVEMWRTALREVANLSGWHLQDRHESEFIQHIVKEMMEKLSSKSSSITKNFIGIESTMAKFIPSYLGFKNNVCMIGIYGMGGLGKTTLARVVYDEYRSHFEGSSYIANVREDSKKLGLHRLQHQLLADILGDKNIYIRNVYDGVDLIKMRLCHKKVLLVIDDVDHLDQLEKLVGEHSWFGLGSWIIITTRDKHVLIQHRVLKIYNPNGLNNDDALKLFCLKAFNDEQPKKGYMQLSQAVVKYANGLPLALVSLGSFLVGRTIEEWKSALVSFKKTKGEIYGILKISYDGLEEMWKEIFLDIACFFRLWHKDKVIQILENCGFDARIGISVLVEKSLITVYDNECLGMHDLLQEMGEKIVHFELGGNLGKRSRLWHNEDLLHILENNMRLGNLKFIDLSSSENLIRTPDFSGVLILERLNLSYCCRLVEIHPSIGQLSRLRNLQLRKCESLTDLPTMSTKMQSLMVLNLSDCSRISSIPKFTGIMKSLSELNLGAIAIKKVSPSSIECLTALTLLDLKFCKNLECLPRKMANLRSLEKLDLYECSKLKSLPRLPSTVRVINADFCNSLKWSPAQVNSWSQPLSRWCLYDESKNRVELTILFHFLQGLLCCKTVYGTSSKREDDGSIVEFLIITPSCLTQTVGNSISIELPSNWYNSKWTRFALEASVSGFIGWKYGIRARVIALGDMPLNHRASEFFTTWIRCEVSICLLYLSRDDWFAKVGNGECSKIEVIFDTHDLAFCVWECCGVGLVYKQDVDEFNQNNAQCSIESFGEVSIYKLTVGDDDGDGDDDDDYYYYYDAYTVSDNDDDDDDDYYDANTVSDDDDIQSW